MPSARIGASQPKQPAWVAWACLRCHSRSGQLVGGLREGDDSSPNRVGRSTLANPLGQRGDTRIRNQFCSPIQLTIAYSERWKGSARPASQGLQEFQEIGDYWMCS